MRSAKAAILAIVSCAVIIGLARPAQAVGQDAAIDNNEFIFYYNSNYGGSYVDFAGAKANLAGYDFLKSGLAGYGQGVKNNAASVANLRGATARVYFNSNYAGVYDQVNAGGNC